MVEPQAAWLRSRIIRLRAALRYARDSRTEAILREIIGDMETRLDQLEQIARTDPNKTSCSGAEAAD